MRLKGSVPIAQQDIGVTGSQVGFTVAIEVSHHETIQKIYHSGSCDVGRKLKGPVAVAQQDSHVGAGVTGSGDVGIAIPVKVSHHYETGLDAAVGVISGRRLEGPVALAEQDFHPTGEICKSNIGLAVAVEISHRQGGDKIRKLITNRRLKRSVAFAQQDSQIGGGRAEGEVGYAVAIEVSNRPRSEER